MSSTKFFNHTYKYMCAFIVSWIGQSTSTYYIIKFSKVISFFCLFSSSFLPRRAFSIKIYNGEKRPLNLMILCVISSFPIKHLNWLNNMWYKKLSTEYWWNDITYLNQLKSNTIIFTRYEQCYKVCLQRKHIKCKIGLRMNPFPSACMSNFFHTCSSSPYKVLSNCKFHTRLSANKLSSIAQKIKQKLDTICKSTCAVDLGISSVH